MGCWDYILECLVDPMMLFLLMDLWCFMTSSISYNFFSLPERYILWSHCICIRWVMCNFIIYLHTDVRTLKWMIMEVSGVSVLCFDVFKNRVVMLKVFHLISFLWKILKGIGWAHLPAYSNFMADVVKLFKSYRNLFMLENYPIFTKIEHNADFAGPKKAENRYFQNRYIQFL